VSDRPGPGDAFGIRSDSTGVRSYYLNRNVSRFFGANVRML
jgi:hypothetical protein